MEFIQYPKIYAIGHENNKELFSTPSDLIVVEEKIDGGNFRFYVNEQGKLVFGSRTQQLTSNEGEDTNVAKDFKRCVDFIRDKVNRFSDIEQLKGKVFFGEACHKHTITYDFKNMPPFLGFDIWDIKVGRFLDQEFAAYIYECLVIDFVPIVTIGNSERFKQMTPEQLLAIIPQQRYALASAEDKLAEGIVFKNQTTGIRAKLVRNEFKEKNAEAFGGNPKYNKVDDTNNAEFLFTYVTNPRIEKIIFKMTDEGKALGMELMGELIKRTYDDVIEENWKEILSSNWKLDFKECRKLVAPRCRSVLQSVMINNSLQ